MSYAVRCEDVVEGLHPSERLCRIPIYSKESVPEKTLQVIVGRGSIKYVNNIPYMEIGVIPSLGRMPHQKPNKEAGIFLIEFPQEALNGSYRAWVKESDLIEFKG